MKVDQLASYLKTILAHMEATGASSASIELRNTQTNEVSFTMMIAQGDVAQDYVEAFQAVSAKHDAAGGTVQ